MLVTARKRKVVIYDVWLKMLNDADASLGRTENCTPTMDSMRRILPNPN